jgi:hypothetical protein
MKAVLSSFNCGREGHVAKDCRRRPTYRGSVGRDTDNRPMCETVGTDTQYRGSVGRDTDNMCESVGRDTRKLNRA